MTGIRRTRLLHEHVCFVHGHDTNHGFRAVSMRTWYINLSSLQLLQTLLIKLLSNRQSPLIMEYSCFRVDPQSQSVTALAQKYKALRLSALVQSPDSFSSTYEIESCFTDEWWESRLQLSGRETFICAARTSSNPVDDDIGEWV
jgi:hypothetical protein